jgi:hypothetical protein
MKTFKQFIEEAKVVKKPTGFLDKALGVSLAFGAASGLLAGGKMLANRNSDSNIKPSTITRQVVSQPARIQQRISTPAKVQQTQASTPVQVQQPQKKTGYQFENEHVRKLYGALVSAEHRGNVKDPYGYDSRHYIRTAAGGGASSAYGPMQITRNTARGYADPKNKYHQDFVAQGGRFLKSDVKDTTHGLGGKGSLYGEEHHGSYQELAVHVMKGKAKELNMDITKPLSQDDLTRFTQHWRHGIKSTNKPEKWYSSTVNKYYYGK